MRYCSAHPNLIHLLHIGCPTPAVQDWIDVYTFTDQERAAVPLSTLLATTSGNAASLRPGINLSPDHRNDGIGGRMLTLSDVRLLMYQLMEAIHFLHNTAEVVHTDIREANILVMPGDNISMKLTGLGSAAPAVGGEAGSAQSKPNSGT